MSNTYTPSPWMVESRARTDSGKYDISAPLSGDGLIAMFVSQEANARLIAAAPDLLEALEGCSASAS